MTHARPYALAHPVPLEWLLDPADPSARLRTLRELLDRSDSSDEVRAAREALLEWAPVKKAFAKQKEDGSWGDLAGADDEEKGTAWTCSWLVRLGVPPRDPRVVKAVRALVEARQIGPDDAPEQPEGAFSFSRRAADTASCVTGDDLVLSMAALGPVEENRRAVLWLLAHQRHDGGWLHCHRWSWKARLNTLLWSRAITWPEETDPAVRSCRFGTFQAMRGLASLPEDLRDDLVRRALTRGAEYFLVRGVTGTLDAPSTDLVPRVKAFNAGLQLVGTVVRHNADMLSISRLLVELGYGHDPRLAPTIRRVAALQQPDGKWPALAASPGMLDQKPGTPSKHVTIDALVLLRGVARSHGVELELTRRG